MAIAVERARECRLEDVTDRMTSLFASQGICRRFLDEKREKLMTMRSDQEQWSNLRQFWNSRQGRERAELTMEKADVLLKGIVKRFFNEKEVTSTLVMDALYSGCRALQLRNGSLEVWMSVEQNEVHLGGDALTALERAACEVLPTYRDEVDWVADQVVELYAAHGSWEGIAILGRKKSESSTRFFYFHFWSVIIIWHNAPEYTRYCLVF